MIESKISDKRSFEDEDDEDFDSNSFLGEETDGEKPLRKQVCQIIIVQYSNYISILHYRLVTQLLLHQNVHILTPSIAKSLI